MKLCFYKTFNNVNPNLHGLYIYIYIYTIKINQMQEIVNEIIISSQKVAWIKIEILSVKVTRF